MDDKGCFVKLHVDMLSRKDLSSQAKLVYASIVSRIRDNSHAWPSHQRIADDTGLCRRSVIRAIKELTSTGCIESENRMGQSCIYRASTCDNESHPPVTDSHTEYIKVNRSKNKPPQPPQGGMGELPSIFDTPEFKNAWQDWIQYRKDTKHKLTDLTIKRQLKQLEAMGHDNAIKSIEQSIERGWTGLFDVGSTAGKRADDIGRVRAKPGKYDRVGQTVVSLWSKQNMAAGGLPKPINDRSGPASGNQ